MSKEQTLEARAAALREEVERPAREQAAKAAELTRVEAELAAQQKAAAKAEAEKRMVAIQRATGALVAEYAEDRERVAAAVQALDAAMVRLNDRYRKLLDLRLEARALRDDHGVPEPPLPTVPLPEDAAARPTVAAWTQVDERRVSWAFQARRDKARAAQAAEQAAEGAALPRRVWGPTKADKG